MKKMRFYFVAGAFALGVILTLAVVYAFMERGASAASALPAPTAPVSLPAPEIVRDAGNNPAGVEPEPNAGTADGLTEGVKVHGHWTIDVLEPDGTLVSRREFENSLMSGGKARIIALLTKGFLPDYWGIKIFGNERPCLSGVTPAQCEIQEPQSPLSNISYISRNLVVSAEDPFSGVMTLSGTVTAQRDGDINLVRTTHTGIFCSPGEFPDNCNGAFSVQDVTEKFFNPPIDVAEGQIMSVTVEIRFE